MLAHARLPKGTVAHLFDVKWAGQRVYRSVCGMYREHWVLYSWWQKVPKECKGCRIEWGRHQRRSAPM